MISHPEEGQRNQAPRMSPRSNSWDVEELKSELSRLARACHHHTILGAERTREDGMQGKRHKRVHGGLAMGAICFPN